MDNQSILLYLPVVIFQGYVSVPTGKTKKIQQHAVNSKNWSLQNVISGCQKQQPNYAKLMKFPRNTAEFIKMTLPETKVAPEKWAFPKRKVVFQAPIFRCNRQFSGATVDERIPPQPPGMYKTQWQWLEILTWSSMVACQDCHACHEYARQLTVVYTNQQTDP